MNDDIVARPPVWFWILAVLGLLWELFGVATYLMHVGVLPSADSGMSAAEQALADGMPAWATAAYAVAVFVGALGALGLVLRKAWSRLLLILSLLALLVQFGWWLFLSGAMEVIGPSAATMPIIVILVAIAARLARRYGRQARLAALGATSRRGRGGSRTSARHWPGAAASVSAKTWPPVPSATKKSAWVGAGSSTAAIDARPGLAIGPIGRPASA